MRFVPTMQRPLVNCKMQRKTSQAWKKMGERWPKARVCCLSRVILLPLLPCLCRCCCCFCFCFTFPMSYTVCAQNILLLLMHRRHVLRRAHATTLNLHRGSAQPFQIGVRRLLWIALSCSRWRKTKKQISIGKGERESHTNAPNPQS